MPLVGLGDQQEVEKGGRGGQHLDPVPFDSCTDMVGVAVLYRDHAAGVGEHVEQRVDAPDMVEQEEGQGDHRVPGRLELLQQTDEVVQRGFTLAGRARGEEHQARVAAGNQLARQVIPHFRGAATEAALLIAINRNHHLHFGDLLKLLFVDLDAGG